MHIFIFEGIATSGKSSTIRCMKQMLPAHLNVRIAGEPETHLPIMADRQGLHQPFFMQLIRSLITEKPDVLIIDRLHMTQAHRAGAKLKKYVALEKLLQAHNAQTIYFKVQESAIADRIQKAAAHREDAWGAYLKTKGSTPDEIAQYYIFQQRSQLLLLGQSRLPYRVFDTTNHGYEHIASMLVTGLV